MKNIAQAFALLVILSGTIPAMAQTSSVGLSDEGVGMYTDPSVANQVSSFTINPQMVSCGVGTVSVNGMVNPFDMLMYALSIDSYVIDRLSPRMITAKGKMRSITRVGGVIVEDTDGTGINPPPHDFIAIAEDRDGPQHDRFMIHFRTPFWNPTNPMCTKSTRYPGLCQFGGDLFLGNVVVTGGQQF